jgi:hypothetical protein
VHWWVLVRQQVVVGALDDSQAKEGGEADSAQVQVAGELQLSYAVAEFDGVGGEDAGGAVRPVEALELEAEGGGGAFGSGGVVGHGQGGVGEGDASAVGGQRAVPGGEFDQRAVVGHGVPAGAWQYGGGGGGQGDGCHPGLLGGRFLKCGGVVENGVGAGPAD